jgi:tripartite-type tricarboxylate transporter receptor subunit TctC
MGLRRIAIATMAIVGCLHVAPLAAQSYPNRPVRVVASAAGGGSDFVLRLLTPGLAANLGQPVIIENRGGGVAAIETVARAQPDGYSLLYYGSILWILPLLQEQVSYNVQKDFSPVTLTNMQPSILLLHPSVAAKTVKELIALARSNRGGLNYGSGGAGSSGHLAAELFKAMANVDIVRVPYKGSGPALSALFSGEVQLLMASASSTAPQVKSGRVRALAVTSSRRSASFPELPTIAEAGVPGYEYGQISGILAPAKTPVATINRLQQEVAKVLNTADVKDKLIANAVDPVGSTPQEFSATIRAEVTRLGKVIKDAGIRGE